MKTVEVTDLKKVESSNIETVAFDGKNAFVQFKNGSLYSYADVGKGEYEALRDAKSVGKHLNTRIKGTFDFSKVENGVLKKINIKKPIEITLLDNVNKILLELRKTGSTSEAKCLTLLKSELINNSKAKKQQDQLKVVQAFHKTLLKAAQTYEDSGADTHAEQFRLEAGFVEQFLPKQMSNDEVVIFIETCFLVHLNYENLTMGQIIGKIKKAIGDKTSNGQLIAQEVKRNMGACSGKD